MPVTPSRSLNRLFNKAAESEEPVEVLSEEVSPSSSTENQLPEQQNGAQTPGLSPLSLRARQHALRIMARHTFEEAKKEQLICNLRNKDTDRPFLQAIALRISKGNYAIFPHEAQDSLPWTTGLCMLNVGAAMTLTTYITEGIVDMIPPGALEVAISPSSHVQVIAEAGDIANARKAQGAAFVLSERCLIIWSDEPEDLLPEARKIHENLTQFLWAVANSATSTARSNNYFSLTPRYSENAQTPAESVGGRMSSSTESFEGGIDSPPFSNSGSQGQLVLASSFNDEKDADVEAGMEDGYEERPTVLIAAINHGLACALACTISVLQFRSALIWSFLDETWIRLAIGVIIPFYFCLVMFFCDNIIGSLFMLFGPVRQLQQNTRYFSGIKPKLIRRGPLPHITIQCPVYKEDFAFVLKPTFESIKKAIKTYELQGGSASIIISEDGMVLLSPEERAQRLEYYDENNITWIGRPKHGKDGFMREGRFKKASNLNFTYDVLLKTEEMVEEKRDTFTGLFAEGKSQNQVYSESMQEVLATIHPDACGSGLDRFGELILLIDCDTRIPEDCFLDAATEMTRSKDVGILQHCSGVMYVSSSFFEKCIGFFTRLVNFSISYAIANGDVAPFMGHNAYLRWSAMKEIGKIVTLPNGRSALKIWSEDHVSEDFVMALGMLEHGYIIRWATYSNSEYMEGVSLSCDDELNRWQKYAWGVSEMIFRPVHKWYLGPITPLYRRFLFGSAPLHYKWASTSYCLSYYAIGVAFPSTLAITLVQGWLGPQVIVEYVPSFKVFLACVVVYFGLGTLSLCIVRFRAGVGGFFPLLVENIKYLPFMVVFFGGLSYHVSTALLSHIFSFNMTWGSTLKDIDLTNFFHEAPLILKRHYRVFGFSMLLIAGLAILAADFVPLEWRVSSFTVLFPAFLIYAFHILFPIVLNPNLIRFSF
ncbi:hypothetical protein CBS101457_004964 [Exobasidium rhododendri]|nr:hypothetical protein CBS101457_004964 [Exobasidium rhododendri]